MLTFDLPSFDDLKKPQQTPAPKPRTLSTIKPVEQPRQTIKIAFYCRVSTEHESQQSSIAIQKQHFLSLAAKHPDWEFCGVYCDIVSGTKAEKRPELQRMLEACRAGKINLILIKSISRFARNTTDLLEMVRALTATGVGIIFDKEHLDTRTMDSEVLLTILATIAEDESHSISSNCRWGLQKRFKDGTYKMSTAPYGFDLENGTLVINETEAAVVREIFDRYIDGEGFTTIADDLNRRGVKTKRAGEQQKNGKVLLGTWSAATIGKMIRNEAYMGDFLMQKTFSDHTFTVRKNKGEQPTYYAEDHHPAIVSREQYTRANQIRESKAGPRGERRTYDLTGRLICGCCGGAMDREVNKSGTVLWVCRRHRKKAADCPLPPIKEKDVLSIFAVAYNEPAVKIHRAQLMEKWRRENDVAALESRLEKVEEELKTTAQAFGADAQAKRNQLLMEKADLQGQLVPDNRITEAEELLQLMKGWDGSSVIFPKVVEQATVYGPDSMTVRYTCGLELGTADEEKEKTA